MMNHELFGVGDDEPLVARLGQAIAWCRPRVDTSNPGGCLRSDRLRPWILQTDRAAMVRSLGVDRARLDPNVTKALPAGARNDLDGGHLLLYLPDQQLADGAAEQASNGFFDMDNTPPWDSWVALVRDSRADVSSRDQLICYVPAELRDFVQRGIDVNPEGGILWLRHAPTTFGVVDHLRHLLALGEPLG
jgi:hypothetical protein